MRRAYPVLAACSLLALASCQQSGPTTPTVPPASAPSSPSQIATSTQFSPEVTLGGYAATGDLSTSALALYDVTLDLDHLSGTATLRETRSGQANDDLYLLSIGAFLKPDSFRISGVSGTATTFDVSWTFTHPFSAPNNPPGTPNGSTNRADLGIAGMIMPLVDVATATGNTYFTDRIANTGLFVNADAYASPAGLLTLSGNIANTFPYQSLVDETGTGSRVGISNGSNVTGNFGTDGWTRSELGGGAPFDKWTGYGVLHQGQASRRSFALDRAQLSTLSNINFTVAVLAKYNDPRQGANAAQKRSHRLPPATPDAALFGYRMPHGALDVAAITFEGASGAGFLSNQISASTLAFHVIDWDARATATTATDLSLDPSVTTVAVGEAGVPDLAVCIPGVLGDQTTVDTWTSATVMNDDSGFGGDAAIDTGQPGDALFYSKSVTKVAGSGQTDGFYTGMVRATDPENALAPALVVPLDGVTLAPLSANLPQPVSYQSFRVIMTGTAGAPVIALTTPANVQSATTTSITVTGAYDPNGQTINVGIDWDNDTVYEDNRTIPAPYTTPILWTRPGNVPYNNPSLTPSPRTIPARFNDGVNPNVNYAPALAFTLGPNRPPVVSGNPGIQLAQTCRPSPATFTLTRSGLTITDPEGDPITFTVVGTPDAGTAITTSNIAAFPFSGAAAGPWTNPNTTEVVFQAWANDPTHTGVGGTALPDNPNPLTGLISGNVGFVRSVGGTATDYGKALGIDSARNIYTGGLFGGTVDFDAGAGVASRTATNSADMYLLQSSPIGNYKRITTWSGAVGATLNAIMVTTTGEVYLAGNFTGTSDLDPGAGSALRAPLGGSDAFAIKLSSTGAFLWAQTWGGTGDDTALCMSMDSNNRIVVGGAFTGTVDFDPGTGTTNASAAGGQDAYILQLNSSGTFSRVRSWGNTNNETITGITWESSGNSYITGHFTGALDVNAGAAIVSRTATAPSALLIEKLDGDLDYLWDAAIDMNVVVDGGIDSENNTAVYVAGAITGTGDFDAGAGTTTVIAGTSPDAFVTRYSSAGAFAWVDTVGSTGTNAAAVTALEVGETLVWAAGRFTGTMDFDPGSGTFNFTATPSASNQGDNFLWRLNAIPGTFNTAVQWGNGEAGQVTDLQFGGCSVFLMHLTGFYSGTQDFDPSAGTVNGTSNGGADAFLMQLRGDILTF